MNELEKAARHFQTVDQEYQKTEDAKKGVRAEMLQLNLKATEQWLARNKALDALSDAALVVPA